MRKKTKQIRYNDAVHYTLDDAAAKLKLARKSVLLYCQRGTIHGQKLGKEWIISEAEILRFSRENRTTGRPKKILSEK